MAFRKYKCFSLLPRFSTKPLHLFSAHLLQLYLCVWQLLDQVSFYVDTASPTETDSRSKMKILPDARMRRSSRFQNYTSENCMGLLINLYIHSTSQSELPENYFAIHIKLLAYADIKLYSCLPQNGFNSLWFSSSICFNCTQCCIDSDTKTQSAAHSNSECSHYIFQWSYLAP